MAFALDSILTRARLDRRRKRSSLVYLVHQSSDEQETYLLRAILLLRGQNRVSFSERVFENDCAKRRPSE